jgi:cobalt/nickel transport system permease protein
MHETLEHVQLNSKKIVDGDVKVYFCLILLLFVLITGKMAVYGTAFVVFSCLSLYAVGGYYLRVIRIPVYFLVSGLIAILLFVPGDIGDVGSVYRLYFLEVSEGGMNMALNTALRALASLSIMSFMVLTTSIPEMFSAFKKMKMPDFAVEISLLVYRVIQILLDELERLERSASSRLGYVSKRAFVNTTALLSYSLFLKSLKRSEKLDKAMSARCYSGVMPTLDVRNRGSHYALAITALLVAVWLLS